jgi:sec-independent protein translocase protein TatC
MKRSAPETETIEMTILDHLDELRKRLTWAFVCLVVGTLLSFIWTRPLLAFLLTYYDVPSLQTLGPAEGVQTFFKVAIVSGAAVAMPGILLNLWWFIAPGLERSERRYVYIFVPSALSLFLGGAGFVLFVLLPVALRFLADFQSDIFNAQWTAQEYIGFVTTFTFWLGVSFELPIIVYFIARLGVVGAKTLREQWRAAIVAIAVIAAMVTPTVDPVTMLLTMAPLLFLYMLSLLLAAVGERQFNRAVAVETPS